MAVSEFTVTIKNWEKYNPRKDVKHTSWFRCDNRILEDPDFYSFTHSEIVAWIYLLSMASQKNSATITVNTARSHRVCGLDSTVVNSAIQKLVKLQIVTTRTLRGRYADVTLRNERDETNVTNDTSGGPNLALTPPPPGDGALSLPVVKNESGLSSKTQTGNGTEGGSNEKTARNGQAFLAAYVKSFQFRYGANTRPAIGGREAGLVKRILAANPLERSCALVQVYLQMDDKWFVTKCHDLVTFYENLGKVGLALDKGVRDPGKKKTDIEAILKRIESEKQTDGLQPV